MPKVKVNDVKLYYEQYGEGKPLVLISPRGVSSAGWKRSPELIPTFSREYKVIIFDNRGIDQSDKPDIEYSIKMMAHDLSGLMDEIGIESAHVLGWSMGGMIAQELALNHPSKVST